MHFFVILSPLRRTPAEEQKILNSCLEEQEKNFADLLASRLQCKCEKRRLSPELNRLFRSVPEHYILFRCNILAPSNPLNLVDEAVL